MYMTTLLITATIIFGLSALYFFTFRKQYGSHFPWLVSFITVISYLVIIMNTSGAVDPVSLLWTRWVGYGVSCTLLTASMVKIFGLTGNQKTTALILTPLIMLTGVLAAIASNVTFLILFFAIGMVPFLALISLLKKASTPKNASVLNYVYFGWMAFPVIFLLSPESFSVVESLPLILGAYLIADVFTKIVFYVTSRKFLRGNREERESLG